MLISIVSIFKKHRAWEHALRFLFLVFFFLSLSAVNQCTFIRGRVIALQALVSDKCRLLLVMMTLGKSFQLSESQFYSWRMETGMPNSQHCWTD